MRRYTALLAASVLLLSAAIASAEDWPAFRGPRGDGISKETGLLDKFPATGLKKLWSDTVGIGYSSPVAVDGKVYLFSTINDKDGLQKDTLKAYDADTGKTLWTASYNNSWTGAYPGTRCSPLIEGDRIYTYGGAGDLAAWEIASGKSVWQANLLAQTGSKSCEWGQGSNPLIVGNLLYVQCGKGGPVAVAVNKTSGKIVWQSEKGLGGYTQPVLIDVQGTQQLIIFGGDNLWAMNPETGKTIWKYPWKTQYDVNSATPIYRDGHLFLTSNYNHGCIMLKLSPTSATKLWENKEVMCRFQGPILEGNILYANSEGTIKCLSWPDGAVKWANKDFRLDMGGSVVRVGDKFVMLAQNGKLALANGGPDGFKLISQAQLVQGKEVWSTPLIYKGKLYAKGATDFVCVEFSAK
ncbi:MAG: PQQ-like beta-propeller repeat protein [Planctomycetota bacterium]|nr:PQQ-like beta-propeller repeat protein [Planctomycetota bacterium]